MLGDLNTLDKSNEIFSKSSLGCVNFHPRNVVIIKKIIIETCTECLFSFLFLLILSYPQYKLLKERFEINI